jgi:hypothetical protein
MIFTNLPLLVPVPAACKAKTQAAWLRQLWRHTQQQGEVEVANRFGRR